MKEIWYNKRTGRDAPGPIGKRETIEFKVNDWHLIADLTNERIACDDCPLNPRPGKRYCDTCFTNE